MEEKKLNIKQYTCPWDGTTFQANVVYQLGGNAKGVVSTQIRCPKCRNFLKTWKTEYTGNSVGRKHIHIR